MPKIMIAVIKSFLQWFFNTPLMLPLITKIGSLFGVPAYVVVTYTVNGFGIYWFRFLIVVLVIIALIIVIKLLGLLNPGNFGVSSGEKAKNSPLSGKHLIFLGSSVTKGFAARGRSFVDMIAERTGASCVKEAVSGTTLADNGEKSYVARLKKLDKNQPCDLFICQLSTNDATKKVPLGKVSDGKDMASLDTKTVCGAIEYIIAYAKETWNCPVAFYTSPEYASSAYKAMVDALKEIAAKWGVQVIDLWNDREANAKENKKHRFMNDQIHPTQKGYTVWTPIIEAALASVAEGKGIPPRPTVKAVSGEELVKQQNSRTVKKTVKGVLCALLSAVIIVAACGVTQANDVLDLTGPYNSNKYAASTLTPLEDSPIKGKTIMWLGSSVMSGFGARNTSMADYMQVLDSTTMIKDCYPGTFIATTTDDDYLPRLLLHDATTDPVVDLLVIQLSTNDCKGKTPVGDPTPDDMRDLSQLDTKSTCGALEYIVGYARETWGCPTLIFSSLEFDKENTVGGQKWDVYQEMVEKTQVICDKWDSYMLDMWTNNDAIMEGVSPEQYDIWMTDTVHPSRIGYLEWWTPMFQESIYKILG